MGSWFGDDSVLSWWVGWVWPALKQGFGGWLSCRRAGWFCGAPDRWVLSACEGWQRPEGGECRGELCFLRPVLWES